VSTHALTLCKCLLEHPKVVVTKASLVAGAGRPGVGFEGETRCISKAANLKTVNWWLLYLGTGHWILDDAWSACSWCCCPLIIQRDGGVWWLAWLHFVWLQLIGICTESIGNEKPSSESYALDQRTVCQSAHARWQFPQQLNHPTERRVSPEKVVRTKS
jgi:hypothetical protein